MGMMITIRRFRRAADGVWDEIVPPIIRNNAPAESWALAQARPDGPIGPSNQEIVTGCETKYRRTRLHGFASPGDIDVKVQID